MDSWVRFGEGGGAKFFSNQPYGCKNQVTASSAG